MALPCPVWDFVFTQTSGARHRVHPPQTGKKVEVVPFFEGGVEGEHPAAGFGGSDGPGTFVRMLCQSYPGHTRGGGAEGASAAAAPTHTRGGGAAHHGVPCKSPPTRMGAPPPQPTRAPPTAQASAAAPAAAPAPPAARPLPPLPAAPAPPSEPESPWSAKASTFAAHADAWIQQATATTQGHTRGGGARRSGSASAAAAAEESAAEENQWGAYRPTTSGYYDSLRGAADSHGSGSEDVSGPGGAAPTYTFPYRDVRMAHVGTSGGAASGSGDDWRASPDAPWSWGGKGWGGKGWGGKGWGGKGWWRQ